MGRLISEKYAAWQAECEERFQQLKKNEEELNRIFIDIYGLQDELTPDVADKDITVHRVFDSKDDVPESMKGSNYVRTMRDEIVSLISYAAPSTVRGRVSIPSVRRRQIMACAPSSCRKAWHPSCGNARWMPSVRGYSLIR